MIFKSHAKVFCRYCGKAISKATVTHYFGGSRSSYGSDWVKDHMERPASREEVQRLVNEAVVQIRWHGEGEGRHVYRATTWDGESYMDQFFCRNVCAEAMGRSAAKFNGVHTESFRRAVEAETARARAKAGGRSR